MSDIKRATRPYSLKFDSYLQSLNGYVNTYFPEVATPFAMYQWQDPWDAYAAAYKMWAGSQAAPERMEYSNQQAQPRQYHIVPMKSGKDITFVDVNGHGAVHVMKSQDGYSLMGPSDMIEILGGRGLGAQIFHMMQDDDYFRDKKLMHHNVLNNGAQRQTYDQY